MKHFSAVLFLLLLPWATLKAQEIPDEEDGYYTPVPSSPPILKKALTRKQLEKQREQMRVLSPWYIGVDLFGRSDISSLDNNYRCLFKAMNSSTIDLSLSGQVGRV